MNRAMFALFTLMAGVAHAEYCREYTIEELSAMSAGDLQQEREQVTQKMIDAFVDDDAQFSEADQVGCETQGRMLDRLIMAHREDAERNTNAR